MIFIWILFGWFLISGLIYFGLWYGFVNFLGPIKTGLINLVASTVLSPGAVVGHGILPFPGGLVVLFGEYTQLNNSNMVFNFVCWMITFLLFSVLNSLLKNKKTKKII
jgi:hypothetical protein